LYTQNSNILHAISNVSLKSKSFTTKEQINPQELKYTKTKRKASNARSKHLTHDDILLLKSNPTITVHRTWINVCLCLLRDDSMQRDTRPGRIVTTQAVGRVAGSKRLYDCAFPRGCPELPDKRRPKSRLSPKNDCDVITHWYR